MRWSESRKVEIIRGVSHIRSGVIFGLSIFSIVVGDHLWSILVILIVVRQKPWLSVATTSWPLLVNEHRMQAGHTFFASLLRMDLILVHLRAWVLVRQGFEPVTSRSADRRSPNWANQAAVEIIINNYILLYNYLYNYIILIITTYYYIINNYILYILLVTCLSNAVWIFLSVKPSPRSFGRRVKRIEISKERPERSAFVPFDKTGFQNVQVNVSTASFQKFHG